MVMPWFIGLKRARELLFFGDMIDAKTALQFGMINRVVPAAELREATMKYAKRLSLISPEALRWGKRVINRGAEIAGFRAALEAGVDSFVSLYATQTDVGKEFGRIVAEKNLKAALEWRAAQFRGEGSCRGLCGRGRNRLVTGPTPGGPTAAVNCGMIPASVF